MTQHPSLRWRITIILLLVALVPLGLVGFGSWIVFGRLLENKTLELQDSIVQHHVAEIDSYLNQRVALLEYISNTNSLVDLSSTPVLTDLLRGLNHITNGGFTDLGVFDLQGNHLAYSGPYDLTGRNYSDSPWFLEALQNRVFISDVFYGYRQVPHCIIAVRTDSGTTSWILRATIDSDQFNTIVQSGSFCESFIVNADGIYQTASNHGNLLEECPLDSIEHHERIRHESIEWYGETTIQATSWINSGRWILVVLQRASAVQTPVRKAVLAGSLAILIACLLVIGTIFYATRRLILQIDKATAERDEMMNAFMRSAKLASVGELATGLAHEINNPLAIIAAEQTNITDLLEEFPESQTVLDISGSAQRIKKQVMRCGSITGKMLKFGRTHQSNAIPAHIGPCLKESIALMERQAKIRNIDLTLEMDNDLPECIFDPIELEQVLVNIITNSFHALPDGGFVKTICKQSVNHVEIRITDNGSGMDKATLNRMFEPFFTTKPVGKGTGLGLSVCYGIVKSWGAKMYASSEVGVGTTMTINLQVAQPGGNV